MTVAFPPSVRAAGRAALLGGLVLLLPASATGQQGREAALSALDARFAHMTDVAMEIWNLAELGYLETESSALLRSELSQAGFRIEAGVAGIPTAFVAEWGSGEPVLGILAEFDALPGINQDAVPTRQPIEGKRAGHACGHHLFGTGSTHAAIAVKEWLEASGTSGTIRLYGTPAEEGGSGKVYMARAGLFEDVDVVLDDKDLRFDIAASGGPGGQGVNTTNSAVQVTHLPTGMIVKCQDERSQIKNKAKALKVLRSRLLDLEQKKQDEAIRDERRGMVRAGDRSEKIRTYNFPQNRITDHRVGITLYKLDRVMEGELNELIDAVVSFQQAALLEEQDPGGPPEDEPA